MRTRSELWKSLAAQGEFDVETVAVIGGVEYSTITAPVRKTELLAGDNISVGNCIAGTLEFTLMTTNVIPKSAQVQIKSRLTDGTQYTEWMTMGTYWINHRVYNDDLIDLSCYDAMMFGRQAYEDNSQSMTWPKAMDTVVTRIAQQMGVQIDSRTDIPTGSIYETVTKPGDEDTLIDMLAGIGAVLGGNWIITPENKLRLVPIIEPPNETYYIVDEEHNNIQTYQGDNLVSQHNEGTNPDVNPAGGGLLYVPVVIGSIETGDNITISRVTMAFDKDHIYTCGDDSGFDLRIENNTYISQDLCDELYARVNGLVYAPFTMTQCCYDPAAEVGDWIICGGKVFSVMYNETATFDLGFRADVSAPAHEELEDEFPVRTAYERMGYEVRDLKQDNSEIKSAIIQLPGQILLTVSQTYATKGSVTELSSQIQQLPDEIMLEVSETYATQEYVSTIVDATMVSDTLHYLATSLSSGVTINTPGWTTTPQFVDATNKYLWTYHTYTYGDDSTSDTSPVITGTYGTDGTSGTGITEVVPLYYAKSNTTAPSKPTSEVTRTTTTGGQWTRAIPALSSSYPYLFTCDQVKYTDNTFSWTSVVQDNATTDLNNRVTTINNDYTPKGQVRSLFAMDATSITISSGTITFNAGTFVFNGNNFSVTSAGKLTCYGAEVNGSFKTSATMHYGTLTTDFSEGIIKYYNPTGLVYEINATEIDLYDRPFFEITGYQDSYISITTTQGAGIGLTSGIGLTCNWLRINNNYGANGSFYTDNGQEIEVSDGIVTSIGYQRGVIFDAGPINFGNVSPNSVRVETISFSVYFNNPPIVIVCFSVPGTSSGYSAYGNMTVGVVDGSVTTTSFQCAVYNNRSSGPQYPPSANYFAYDPTGFSN